MNKIIFLKLTENLHCPDCGAEITVEVKNSFKTAFVKFTARNLLAYTNINLVFS